MRASAVVAPFLLLVASTAWGAPFAYVTGCRLDTCDQVTIVDTAGDVVSGAVPIAGPPEEAFPSRAVAVNASGTRAYVSSFYGNGLAVVDVASNTQIALVPTLGDGGFDGVAVSPDETRVWVTDDFSGIAIIDATTNTLLGVQQIGTLGFQPMDVVAHPDGQRLYVTTDSPAGVAVLDTATLTPQAFIPGTYTRGIAVSADGTRVYAGDSTRVLVIDTSTDTLLTTIPVPAFTLAVHPDGSRLYATNGAGSLTVVDTATNLPIATVPVGSSSWGITVHPDGTRVYVTSDDSAGMAILDTATNTVTGTVPVGTQSTSVVVIPLTTEADLKCYKGKTARGTTRFTPRALPVVDVFETKSTSVTKPADFCTPITGTGNVPAHRTCYAAADVKGQPPFAKREITTTDRFGTHTLVVSRTSALCLPGAGTVLDDVKCHTARAKPHTFTPQTTSLTDDYETKPTDLLKPVLYCESAGVDGGVRRTPAARRVCYKIRDVKGQPPFAKRNVAESDAFGALTLTLTKADLLCVPATP